MQIPHWRQSGYAKENTPAGERSKAIARDRCGRTLLFTLELFLQLIFPTTLLPLRLWSWVQRPPLFCTEPLLIELLLQMKLALRSFELFRVILCRLRE